LPSKNKVSKKQQHYKYKPQKEYADGIPWHKEVIRRIEKFNKILFLRFLGKLLKIRPVDHAIPLEEISSVLIIRYDALGDMIVTTPLWRILKRLKPSIKIGVAGSFKNLDLLRSDSDIDSLYDYTASSMRDFFRLSKETRKQKWDVVLMGNFNQKTRNAIISRLASPKGITATVGSANVEGHHKLFSRLISLPLPMNKMPMPEQLQYLMKQVILLPQIEYERPSIIIDNDIIQHIHPKVQAWLTEINCKEYITINTDAPAFKKWTIENNIALAEYISEAFPEFGIMITSLPENQGSIENILQQKKIPRVAYFTTPNIHVMTALIRFSKLIITPDTSIVHLASAENKPVVAFYLAAGEWLPYKVPYYVILPKKGEAISTIPLDIVQEAVKKILTGQGLPSENIIYCDDTAPQYN
jgi:ADP-heptose:LPS heptosyltransferase